MSLRRESKKTEQKRGARTMAAAASLPWFWDEAIIGSGAAGLGRSLSTGDWRQQTRLACRQTGRDAPAVGWLSGPRVANRAEASS
jgi:hypothetical protein